MIFGQLSIALAVLVTAQPAANTSDSAKAAPGEISKEQASTLRNTCGARRFETTADVPSNGKVRRTKITLCAADGDTNAEWVSKLEKAAAQIEAHPTFPIQTKTKLVGDLRAEIARVKTGQAPFDLGKSLKVAEALPSVPVASAPVAPIVTSPRLPPASPLADLNALPPLPRSPASASAAPKKAAVATRPGPKLTVQCVMLGDDRAQRCGLIANDERLVVRAAEAFDGPVRLRFSRVDSDATTEVVMASRSLKAGQTARFAIPKEICAGRIRAKFEIETVSPGTSTARLGPFETRCGT